MRKLAIALALAALLLPAAALAQTKLRVATCARTITTGVGAPFAVAMKMGWFKQEGIEVEIVPLPGSTDCVKNVATKEMLVSLPSVEPLAIGRPQGIKAKLFYTAYETNGYGLAVPMDSPIQKAAELKGKTIGVTNMASAGVIIARAQVAAAGLNPDTDVTIVVAGEGAQPAAMIRNKQVDALSQFDTQYALIDNAGVKMRYLDRKAIERFPGNGFLALEESIKTRRKDLVGLGRAYAKGTIFTLNNPEAAVRIVYEMFPQTKPTGKDEATAVRDDVKVLEARMPHWLLEPAGVTKWGENSERQLPRLRRLPAQVGRHQAEGRHARADHERADRRHQQARRGQGRGGGQGVPLLALSGAAGATARGGRASRALARSSPRSTNAMTLATLRTAWSRPQRASSDAASAE